VVMVVVITLDAIPDITDASSGDGDKPPPPSTNAVTANDDNDNGVGAPTMMVSVHRQGTTTPPKMESRGTAWATACSICAP